MPRMNCFRIAWLMLAIVLVVPVWWGLHATAPWDVDNIAPGSVLKALRAHFGPGWYSSYGPAPYLLTAIPYAAVLAFMHLIGELGRPSSEYPWGFSHPESAMAVLGLTARFVSLAFALVIAWVVAKQVSQEDGAGDSSVGIARPSAGVRSWLIPVLLAGAPAFVYYARTSNVDMHMLFWTLLGFALVSARRPSAWWLFGGAAAATLAVSSKEQVAPLGAVIVLSAYLQARQLGSGSARQGLARPRWQREFRAIALVLLATMGIYCLVWNLPVNMSGWAKHHRFLFETARYPRTFPATPAGLAGLGLRVASQGSVALGLPVLMGLALAIRSPSSLRGLGWQVAGSVLYVTTFIGSIGYVYPRFLLPFLALALPLAARGWDSAFRRAGGPLRPALLVALCASTLVGGPLLDVVMLMDPRHSAERWLADQLPAGTTVEVAGNPHYQARLPYPGSPEAVRMVTLITNPDSLAEKPHGPRGNVVLTSSLDDYLIFGRQPLGAAFGDTLLHGPYRIVARWPSPPVAALFQGLSVAPGICVFVREGTAIR